MIRLVTSCIVFIIFQSCSAPNALRLLLPNHNKDCHTTIIIIAPSDTTTTTIQISH